MQNTDIKRKSKSILFWGIIPAVVLLCIILYYIFTNFFNSEDSMIDGAGNVYETFQVGEQIWIVKNLNFANHKEGESWCYQNKDENCDLYGRLYNWDAAMSACPDGWKLSSDEDWTNLEENLTNLENFLLSGHSWKNRFYDMEVSGSWWSSTAQEHGPVWSRFLQNDLDEFIRNSFSSDHAFSVRCVKNAKTQ